jgi:hypothetical protein
MKTRAAETGKASKYRKKKISVERRCSHLGRKSPIFKNHLAPILGEVSK